MASAAKQMAQMLSQQVELLKRYGLHREAAQAADEIRHLRLLAELQTDR